MFYAVCYIYYFYLNDCKNTKFFFFFLGSLEILGGSDG